MDKELEAKILKALANNEQVLVLKFDSRNPIDLALYGLVKAIIEESKKKNQSISIQNKAEAIELLELMENNTMIVGPHRATFARIRQAVEQMEDA